MHATFDPTMGGVSRTKLRIQCMNMFRNASDNLTAADCLEPYSTAQYVAVAAVRAGVGAFSALCSLAVIGVIFLHNRYRHFTQRLMLNLAISALLHSFSYTIARVDYSSNLDLLDNYCYFGGFITLYSAWVEVLALLCIVYYLCVAVLLGRHAYPSHKTEVVFWIGTYGLPLLWCWIPYIDQAYGAAGSWCGIRTLKQDCSSYEFGKVLQFMLWYIPLYILLTATFIVALVVAVKMWRDVHRWSGLYDEESKANQNKMKTEIRPLLWFPVIYLALNTFSLIDRIYNNAIHPENPEVALTFLHACTSPLRGAFVALVFTLAGGRVQWRQVKATCLCQNKSTDIEEYPAVQGDVGDSLAHPYEKVIKT